MSWITCPRLCKWVAGICLLGLSACHTIQRSLHTRYHRITTKLLNKAVVVGGTELDTGRYVVLNYSYYSNRRGVTDNWYSKEVYLQLRDLAALPVGQAVAVPGPAVRVLGHARATWYFEQFKSISGTITRLNNSPTAPRLRIALQYQDEKQKRHPLLNQTVRFPLDATYFQRQQKDYHGQYEDLRLALKEPAKVKSLDLTTYAIQYRKRNGRDSGPDTLYRRLGELYNLEELKLHLSDLKEMPVGFGKLKRLKKLDLSYNDLSAFPVVLYELDSLRELNLGHNDLDSLPASLPRLKALRVLNLDDNRFRRYPAAINNLPWLEELYLGNASLRTVPASIGQLTQLRVLELEGFWNHPRRNQLQELTPIGQLSQLRRLDLHENGTIKSLPESLYQLQNLVELDLRGNPIDSAQVDVKRFPRLEKLAI
ncbi:leucine-rich repeat domain-containing protein [Hymenobacter jeollabukensis]|uniref:Leucine-rich repeat domain-containing protein n=1 Tax=Hymenobacter jeollabukensis TaxID=2025313 RepID=A0A5R8WNM1_9BACT|nr:leucine-rich repeat domain-containing protein [Hymenobacter jeollabukensis]TLM91160.1 leucine-rich repeat domain-containing protein [Hymenobacter jeollabukensis]